MKITKATIVLKTFFRICHKFSLFSFYFYEHLRKLKIIHFIVTLSSQQLATFGKLKFNPPMSHSNTWTHTQKHFFSHIHTDNQKFKRQKISTRWHTDLLTYTHIYTIAFKSVLNIFFGKNFYSFVFFTLFEYFAFLLLLFSFYSFYFLFLICFFKDLLGYCHWLLVSISAFCKHLYVCVGCMLSVAYLGGGSRKKREIWMKRQIFFV